MEELGAPAAAGAAVREHTAAALDAIEHLPFSRSGRADMRELVEDLAGRSR
jgi:hypothetical protein